MRPSAQLGKYGPNSAGAFAEPARARSGLHWIYLRELLHKNGWSRSVTPWSSSRNSALKDARVCRAYGMVSRPLSKKSGGPVQPVALPFDQRPRSFVTALGQARAAYCGFRNGQAAASQSATARHSTRSSSAREALTQDFTRASCSSSLEG
jgi:hypothetical protein